MQNWLIPLSEFQDKLGQDGKPFYVGMRSGSMSVELFAPDDPDTQQPHEQDEIYIILRGSGIFSKSGEARPFQAGDVIFVEARVQHRFESFSPDFATWVIFWGPVGGEGA